LAGGILRPEQASLAMIMPDANGRANEKLGAWLGTL
jgi:hypothetical protein